MGYVQKIELNRADFQQVILKLKIREKHLSPQALLRHYRSEGIMRTDYVALKALTATAPAVIIIQSGEKYSVIPSKPSLLMKSSLLMKLSTALEEVTKTIKELSDNIERIE